MSSEELRNSVKGLMDQARSDLAELVSYRSVADPEQQPPEECKKAADWIVGKFRELGFDDIATSETSDGSHCIHGSAAGPEGAPTVLLYCHYDVQPPLGEDIWRTPVWELVEGDDGRWYGRGSADCKGNVIMHLTALRALKEVDGSFPVNVKLIVEGSEEQGTGGLEDFVPENVDLLRADAISVVDTGNAELGLPTLTTSLRGMTSIDVTIEALDSAMHSGMFGGPAPDPVAGLTAILASLHDADGNTTVDGLDNSGTWSGEEYEADQFRRDAHVLDGVDLVGSGSVADMLWARYDATVVGIDIPPVVGSASAIQASARARVSLRIPPGGTGQEAQDALINHLESRVPWNLRFSADRVASGDPFTGSLSGPAFDSLKAGLEEAYGREMATIGQGGSIPLCNVFQETYPEAEIMLYGVEEPKCLIHAPNESVDPSEIENIALGEALFLKNFGG
ncbi:MAG: dipeptidase [Solirubrobacterales bacterium]|nr:dipeptidase [Solirubrobacterales bacterium]